MSDGARERHSAPEGAGPTRTGSPPTRSTFEPAAQGLEESGGFDAGAVKELLSIQRLPSKVIARQISPLQRCYGNHAVTRLLRSDTSISTFHGPASVPVLNLHPDERALQYGTTRDPSPDDLGTEGEHTVQWGRRPVADTLMPHRMSAGARADPFEQATDRTTESAISSRERAPAIPAPTTQTARPTRAEHQHRVIYRQSGPGHSPSQGQAPACREPIRRAANLRQYIDLVATAEQRLIDCGHTTPDGRIQILSGIYYGTTWSRDFEVEKSEVRNLGFQVYTARVGPGADPRACLGCGLFESLKQSQDVAGVDMGHVLIGINARESFTARSVPIPTQGATGLELSTWVGDLGGAAARVALDRVTTPRASAVRYFGRGTDYGATSNLEGDLAAYLVASGASATSVGPPVLPASGRIADVLRAYFLTPTGRNNRCWQFLAMQGGRFSGRTLTNRAAVEQQMAPKFAAFGRWYMVNYLRQRGRLGSAQLLVADANLAQAGNDVAILFVDWLLACLPATLPSPESEPGLLDQLLRGIGL